MKQKEKKIAPKVTNTLIEIIMLKNLQYNELFRVTFKEDNQISLCNIYKLALI